jgi:hypothetical protein
MDAPRVVLLKGVGCARVCFGYYCAVVCEDLLRCIGAAPSKLPLLFAATPATSEHVFMSPDGLWVTLNVGAFVLDMALLGVVPRAAVERLFKPQTVDRLYRDPHSMCSDFPAAWC